MVLVAIVVIVITVTVSLAILARAGVFAGASAIAVTTSPSTNSALPPPVPCKSCWHPRQHESWQIQLDSTPKRPFLKVAMTEVDGFDTSAGTVAALHRTLTGRGVVCYIDAGTWENWRPDAREFPRYLLGKPDGPWHGERWLDIARFHGILGQIMQARARMCQRKGFNAIDFDNVDGYANKTGFALTAADQLHYDIFLANTAHRLGLAVALKNDLAQVPTLLKYFDFAVDEQCFQYRDCLSAQNGGYGLDEFTAAHKAVFDIEYKLKRTQFCPQAIKDNFNAIRKGLNLGPWRQACT